jgi:hypothetical protein
LQYAGADGDANVWKIAVPTASVRAGVKDAKPLEVTYREDSTTRSPLSFTVVLSQGNHTSTIVVTYSRFVAGVPPAVLFQEPEPSSANGTCYEAVDPSPDHILSGQILNISERLTSSNLKYHFDLQTDGNLVLYKGWDNGQVVIWETHTANSGANSLTLYRNGTLDLSKGNSTVNSTVWSTSNVTNINTSSAYLWMQQDGNLAVYGGSCCNGTLVWQTNTSASAPKL